MTMEGKEARGLWGQKAFRSHFQDQKRDWALGGGVCCVHCYSGCSFLGLGMTLRGGREPCQLCGGGR